MAWTVQQCVKLPSVLTGPIFAKELRVSSRRRRNYVLRFFYILCLTVFVTMVWLSVVNYSGNAVYRKAQMAMAGKQIVLTIVAFQFIATQVLAVIMLSTAISDEIYHRTLGLLMTTSIDSLQIVTGKLLQLTLLVGITLPILAVVRIFGGVPWDYLLSSLCVTLTAAFFAGSLSLLFSIHSRRAYAVILRTVFVLGCVYFVLPALAGGIVFGWLNRLSGVSGSAPLFEMILAHLNPMLGFWQMARNMSAPGTATPFHWPLHCVIMLAVSGAIVAWSVRIVRRVALRQATGQLDLKSRASASASKTAKSVDPQSAHAAQIKRVVGLPVVWKELRAPFIRGVDNRNSYIGLGAAVAAQLITYILLAWQNSLHEGAIHAAYALLFVTMGLIFNTIFSATSITTERESQSWLLLLTTPLGDWEILLGEAIAAFRRGLAIWALLAAHVLLFVLVGYIHPIACFHLAILVLSTSCFAISLGLYFSSRLTHTSSAVIASFALLLGLWVAGPVLAGALEGIVHRSDLFVRYVGTHPLVQTDLILSATAGRQNARLALRDVQFGADRPLFVFRRTPLGFAKMTRTLVTNASIYGIASLLFLWRAKCRLRKKVF
jgi:ABC-type transport system involved in multi-copper enzyme maturation permease subunit